MAYNEIDFDILKNTEVKTIKESYSQATIDDVEYIIKEELIEDTSDPDAETFIDFEVDNVNEERTSKLNKNNEENVASNENSSKPIKKKDELLDLNFSSLKFFKCEYCPTLFPKESQLKFHLNLHLNENIEKHECDECHVLFSSFKNFFKHKQRVHGEIVKCKECSTGFTTCAGMRLHMRLHTGEKPYSCNECAASFIQLSHLNIHKRTHTGEKPYECTVCQQKFKQISHLRSHERIHSQTKPYSCQHCSLSFIQKSSLNRHNRIHTGEKPYICTICSTAFGTKANLNRHMIVHSGNLPFRCQVCRAHFAESSELKKHMSIHNSVTQFPCKQCDALFSRKINLKYHEMAHSGLTPFKCSICEASFLQPKDLKKHQSKHKELKKFNCNLCKKNYANNSSLKNHKCSYKDTKLNTKNSNLFIDVGNDLEENKCSLINAFKCCRCDLYFKEITCLKNHMIEIHGENIEDEDKIDSHIVLLDESNKL